MDKFERYCAAVSGCMKHATSREKYDAEQELKAHLEDHAEALMSRGLSREEAEQRSVAEMGDPQEIGNALNAQLSRAWLYLGRFFMILFLCAVVILCRPTLALGRQVFWNLGARLGVEKYLEDGRDFKGQYTAQWEKNVHITNRVGDYVVQINRVGVGTYRANYQEGYRGYCVCVVSASYPVNPLRPQNEYTGIGYLLMRDGTGSVNGGGTFDAGASYHYDVYPVEYGAEQVTLTGRVGEEAFSIAIPLDWAGVQ